MARKLAQSESEIQDLMRYEPFEKTRFGCVLVQGLILGKRFLDFKSDPVRFYRGPKMRRFTGPFLEYCRGKFSLREASEKKASPCW